MKQVMKRLAADGAAVILSSHMLGLIQEVCTHLLILKNGQKIADGTVAEIQARYGSDGSGSLEDVFFRATGDIDGDGVREDATGARAG
jgi:ABC-2 type transport system ATP-binding protein